jgi:four helix bundle protein
MQSVKLKMQHDRQNLSERFLDYGAMIVHLALKFANNAVERHIGLQLLRAATSSGANYQEACAAESRADFVHKMQIVLKELRESLYWLKLINKSFQDRLDVQLDLNETQELANIVAKSIVTTKGRSL